MYPTEAEKSSGVLKIIFKTFFRLILVPKKIIMQNEDTAGLLWWTWKILQLKLYHFWESRGSVHGTVTGVGGGGVWHIPDGGRTDPKNQNFKIVLETFLEKNFRLKTIFYWFLAQFQSGVDSHIFPLGILQEFHVNIHKIEKHHENVKKNRFDTILGPRMWKNIKRNILEYPRVL